MRVPTDQKTASELRICAEDVGKNSRKMAASTGRFPPTPNPKQAYSAQVPTQFGPPPDARPNTPHKKSVVLKANRRPMRSDARPQKVAPTIRPTNKAQVVKRT
ncbi:unnamed protein product [Aspergillus oryzae]|uniref:Unnamed protein product n=2 Tax=Aspergillus oryzae TaxID=5062 RepID=A0AAN4YIP3_ASPOZ|nr:unnamed protein product [Aspergillus oryzae]GMF90984.1 unnamed protein product [Aspergillus oryzae]GMG12658.1 unnamed protein product [Aspergillus oryzae]GMG27642.1 unnamed protein product [Aspergillus oryzae]GMG53935.1 unnamed protein product [Aspergillus oryzae var. brunneus]